MPAVKTFILDHVDSTHRPRWLRAGRFMAGAGAVVFVASTVTACGADFVDLRSEEARAIATADAGVFRRDAGVDDGASATDAGVSSAVPGVVSIGTWGGRSDYDAAGTATIVRGDDGSLELQLSDDFVVDRVPGPVVVLSYRSSIGRRIAPSEGDVEIGRLVSNSGAQTYPLPEGVDDRPFVWVYCKPFGIEVARAEQEAQ